MLLMKNALEATLKDVEGLRELRPDTMQISRDVGELLAAIGLAHRAQTIVEIGTSYGFSGLWWSSVLEQTDGHLHTIDVMPHKAEAARASFAQAGVADRVTSYLGDARDVLSDIPGPIDLAFIDADKPSSPVYVDLLWPKLRVGGAILTDNVLSHADEFGSYVDDLRARNDAHTAVIPIRAGIAYTVKTS